MRLLLDSNVIIAAFASRGLCEDLYELCLVEHDIYTTEILLQEVHKGLCKKLKVPEKLANQTKKEIKKRSNLVKAVTLPKDSCRDKDDIEVLGAAIAGDADAIVTGDNDLLVLEEFQSIQIYKPRAFWEHLQNKEK